MKLPLLLRVGIGFGLLILIFFTPWWFAALLLIIAAIVIKKYGEVVILGILLDSFYGVPDSGFFHMYGFTFGAIVAFLVIEYIRSKTFTVQ